AAGLTSNVGEYSASSGSFIKEFISSGSNGLDFPPSLAFILNTKPTANTATLTTNAATAVSIDLRTLVSDTESAKDNLTFSVGGAVGGTVTLKNKYFAESTPSPGFTGPGSFTYSVTDESYYADPANTVGPVKVTVNVQPGTPTTPAVQSITYDEKPL